MKTLSLVLASAAVLFASSAMADGIKIDAFGSNNGPIVAGQYIGKIGVDRVNGDIDLKNTAAAVVPNIETVGVKVDSVKVVGDNNGIVAAIQIVPDVGAREVGGSIKAANIAAGVAPSISLKD